MIHSGSTLQYKIAASLLESRGLGRRWVYCPPKELEAKLCGKQVEAMGGAVKIHTITPTVDSLLRTGRAKALYSFRDLRDVTVSAMRAFRLEWPAFKADRYLEHALATELQLLERPGVLVQKYETVIRDLPTAITQIARHLGITLAAGEMKKLAHAYSLTKQRQRLAGWRRFDATGQRVHPPELHIKEGEIGAWPRELNSAIASEITIRYSDWLVSHGYPLVAALGCERDDNCFVPHVGWLSYEPGDNVVASLRDGDFEYLEQAAMFRLLRPGDSFVDCGAHCGLYSRLAAVVLGGSGRIIAIEPDPDTFARLVANTQALAAGNFSAHNLAIGKSDEEVLFFSGQPGRAAFNHIATAKDSGYVRPVRQSTLPVFFQELSLGVVDFLKIDIEGAEITVLEAARALLIDKRVRAILIEFNEENLRRYDGDCMALAELLQDCGYLLFAVDRTKFELISVKSVGQEQYTNYIATSDEVWLRERFASTSTTSVIIANDILRRGSQIATLKGRLYQTITEQNTLIKVNEVERARLNLECCTLRADARESATVAQRHIDKLLEQVRRHSADSEQQAAYIMTLEKERDRLSADASLAQTAANHATQDAQQHIDKLLVQLQKLAASSLQQTDYIATLEKERDRLSADASFAQTEGRAQG